MEKAFTTHLLIQDADGQVQFTPAQFDLHPGQALPAGREETVLLAGGFPAIAPDTGFLLSPTLQLNADLSSATPSQLEKIAYAEKQREQEKQYRSYTVDTDARLCVVAASVESLDAFTETYGGLLAIEPLLIKGSHPEIPTVTEISIDNGLHSGVVVDYALRVPLDRSRCTYCGQCGITCPEKCISSSLHFDFTACTFCKKCEEVCPHGAIEVYGVEYRHLKMPALVILDGCQIEGAEGCRAVYREENIDAYLKNLYSFQVDEIVSINNSLCQYNGNLDRGCRLCAEACQYDAIDLSGGVSINPLRCEECGDCVAACPTGALQYERLPDQNFVHYIESLDTKDASTIVLASADALHSFWWHNRDRVYHDTFFLACDRVEFFSLFHFLYLYSQGFSRIIIATDSGESGQSMRREARLANTILTALFACEAPLVISEELDLPSATPRNLIDHAPVPLSGKNRREGLARIIESFVRETGNTPGFKGNEQTPFATISCDNNSCTQCMSCINGCKIGAMRADATEMVLSHNGGICVGCGLCVSICPENALQMSRAWQFTEEFFSDQLMAAGEPMACIRCGKIFGTRKSYDRVMSILAGKESVDTSHFEYCEDCRVRRIFEEQN